MDPIEREYLKGLFGDLPDEELRERFNDIMPTDPAFWDEIVQEFNELPLSPLPDVFQPGAVSQVGTAILHCMHWLVTSLHCTVCTGYCQYAATALHTGRR